jgi:hypothetical protein
MRRGGCEIDAPMVSLPFPKPGYRRAASLSHLPSRLPLLSSLRAGARPLSRLASLAHRASYHNRVDRLQQPLEDLPAQVLPERITFAPALGLRTRVMSYLAIRPARRLSRWGGTGLAGWVPFLYTRQE